MLRLQPGDALVLFNGSDGADWPGEIVRIGRRDVEVRLGASLPGAKYPELPAGFAELPGRLIPGTGHELDVGPTHHPDGDNTQVAVSTGTLGNGAYDALYRMQQPFPPCIP